MVDLLDVIPQTTVGIVKLNGLRIKVYPVPVRSMAALISRFPKLKEIINSDFGGDNFVLRLFEGVGTATSAIIAAGSGRLGDAEYEQTIEKWLPEEQLKLLEAVIQVTFPNGLGSFLEQLNRLLNGPGEGAKAIKVRLKPSRSISQRSSESDSHPTMQ